VSNHVDQFGAPPPPHGYAPPPAPARTSGMAIAALILGIAGCCGITAPIGIILGFVALSSIRGSQGRLTGRGLAIAGIVTGFLWIGLLAWQVPNLVRLVTHGLETGKAVATRTERFLTHLRNGEAEAALAETSEKYRGEHTAAELRSMFEAAVQKHGALRSWELGQQEGAQGWFAEAHNEDVELRLKVRLRWERDETEGEVVFRFKGEEILRGPLDPPIDGFRLGD
jgi:hypothetical protein